MSECIFVLDFYVEVSYVVLFQLRGCRRCLPACLPFPNQSDTLA